METKDSIHQKIQAQLAKGIEDAVSYVLNARRDYFSENPAKRPKLPQADKIISTYSTTAAVISAGTNLIPGPAGMIAAVPEAILVIKSQFSMIYDLGVAYDKETVMTKELMLGIFLATSGAQGVQMLIGEGGKILVRSSSSVVMQKVTTMLGAEVTEALLSNMVAKWLPLVGASAMAAWSKYATVRLGNKAVSILEKEIQMEAKPLTEMEVEKAIEKIVRPIDSNYEIQKIQVLINLMKIDRVIHPAEKTFLEQLIERSSIPDKERLLKKLDTDEICEVNYGIFANYPERTVDLLIDMVAFAKIDNDFSLAQRIYLRKVCKELGLSEPEITELLT